MTADLQTLACPPADPAEETRRLAVLHDLGVLDTLPEAAFDAITASAASVCGVPIALISLVDAQRQWFKSNIGLEGVEETPRDIAFCHHAIRDTALFEVADATLDERFARNPIVTGDPGIRFYAGAPIVMRGGERIGTVCVIDRSPRQLDAQQRAMLQGLAAIVGSTLLQRKELLTVTARLADSESHFRAIVEDQSELISKARRDGTLTFVNAAYARHYGFAPAEMVGRNLLDFVDPVDREQVRQHLEEMYDGGLSTKGLNRTTGANGASRWVEWTNRPLLDVDGRVSGLQSVGRDITDQRIAEEKLAASELRVRRLYEATPAILHSIDADGRILNVSDHWLALLGYEREEVIGRRSSDFLTPASQAYARDVVLPTFFRVGRCDGIEYQFMHRDGSLIDVRLSATVERDAHGAVARSLAVMEDVTAHKRVEAELGRTHAHLDAVVDNMPALVGYWDHDAVTRFANRDFQAAVGLPTDCLIGRPLPEIFATIDAVGYEELAPRVAAVLAGRRQEFEFGMLTTSGLRQMRVTLVPARPSGDRIDGFYGTWIDITGMKALELRQRDSEQRYRLLFDHLGSAHALHAVEVDGEGRPVNYRYLAMNPAYSAMLGLDPAKAIGMRATDMFPGIADDPADWIGRFGRVALTGQAVHFEQFSAVSSRWFEVTAYRPAQGQFAVIAQDVSERKRLEAELAENTRRLAEAGLAVAGSATAN